MDHSAPSALQSHSRTVTADGEGAEYTYQLLSQAKWGKRDSLFKALSAKSKAANRGNDDTTCAMDKHFWGGLKIVKGESKSFIISFTNLQDSGEGNPDVVVDVKKGPKLAKQKKAPRPVV